MIYRCGKYDSEGYFELVLQKGRQVYLRAIDKEFKGPLFYADGLDVPENDDFLTDTEMEGAESE